MSLCDLDVESKGAHEADNALVPSRCSANFIENVNETDKFAYEV